MEGMMTDRELLELAAKAAGWTVVRWTDDETALLLEGIQEPFNALHENPHSDCMGDALRLAVKLGMDFGIYLPTSREAGRTYANTKELLGYGTDGYAAYQNSAYSKEDHQDDPRAATRRAIVRAAAEVGK
jgi:hypothetical protein